MEKGNLQLSLKVTQKVNRESAHILTAVLPHFGKREKKAKVLGLIVLVHLFAP